MDSFMKKRHLKATREVYVYEYHPFRHSKKSMVFFFEIVN